MLYLRFVPDGCLTWDVERVMHNGTAREVFARIERGRITVNRSASAHEMESLIQFRDEFKTEDEMERARR